MERGLKRVLTVFYVIGAVCVCVLLGRMIIGGNNIINPEAMLPVTYAESSTFILAAGSFPMCLVSFFLFAYSEKRKRRLLLLIPAAITLLCLLYLVICMIAAIL